MYLNDNEMAIQGHSRSNRVLPKRKENYNSFEIKLNRENCITMY